MVNFIERGEYEIMTPQDHLDFHLKLIEDAGRMCWRSSKGEMTLESAGKFIDMLERRDPPHESPVEHSIISVKFKKISRGFTHELVRHRIASYSQPSTRYVDFSGDEINLKGFEMEAVLPRHRDWGEQISLNDGTEMTPREMMMQIEKMYRGLRQADWVPQDARQVLPIGLANEILMSANFREWRHVFALRTAKPAHWEIREVMGRLLEDLKVRLPPVFVDFVKAGEDDNGLDYYKMVDRR